MTGAEDEEDEPFRPPLPMEDRLWRHPSEVAADQRAESSVTVTTVRTPLKHALALASVGAVGGAMLVAGLFLTLGGSATIAAPSGDPIVETIALNPFVRVTEEVPADHWPATVASRASAGVAAIRVTNVPGAARHGSGVVFRNDGYVMTSHDLVGGGGEISLVLPDGSTHEASLVGTDTISGIAVVSIAGVDVPSAPLAIIGPVPAVGDEVLALGGGVASNTPVDATISASAVNVPVADDQNLHGLLQLDVAMAPDADGGAVVASNGGVIGVIVDVGAQNATYAVPIGYARKIAGDIVEWGVAKHSWLGIRGIDEDALPLDRYGFEHAVRVQSVMLDSPANNAEIAKGDLIVAIDGVQVASMTQLILELRNHPPGESVELVVYKDGVKLRQDVELATRAMDGTT